MKISEILSENIFTTDYKRVMEAVATLYKEHYDIDIWQHADAHDEAAKVLMKEHPTLEELDYIIDSAELPERFMDLDFPLNDDIMYGVTSDDETVSEEPASRALCQSGKPDSALGASQLSSCKSQGFRARDTEKKFTINRKRQKIKGKKVKGGNYGGPLPVWKGNQ